MTKTLTKGPNIEVGLYLSVSMELVSHSNEKPTETQRLNIGHKDFPYNM